MKEIRNFRDRPLWVGLDHPLQEVRPPILPEPWKRADKACEKPLIAMLANGYAHAQTQKTMDRLGLPFSQEALTSSNLGGLPLRGCLQKRSNGQQFLNSPAMICADL